MPAGYTHLQFGKDVILHLDFSLQKMIYQHLDVFYIGLHGPDIFFYHHPYNFKDKINRYGKHMHGKEAYEFFDQARDIIQDDDQLCYILGFLCHFLLDSQMHGYIQHMIDHTNIGHFEIESEYDRHLMTLHHHDPLTTSLYQHIQYHESIVSAIQPFFPFSYLEIYDSLKGMKFYDRLLLAKNPVKRSLIYSFFHLTFHYQSLQGLVMNYRTNPTLKAYYPRLDKLYQNALKEAMDYLPQYVQLLKSKEPLPQRFYNNYKYLKGQ